MSLSLVYDANKSAFFVKLIFVDNAKEVRCHSPLYAA